MSQGQGWRRTIGRGSVLGAIVLVPLAVAVACTGGSRAAAAVQRRVAPPEGGVVIASERWKEIDRLVGEQKLEEASKVAAELLAAARAAGDTEGWTRGLVSEVQLRIGLHGYETAVRFLKEQPWPQDPRSQAVLSLFYARSLTTYLQAYSWEINQREKVESREVVDLKAWTKDEIVSRAVAAFAEVWAQRQALGRQPVAELAEYVDANSYPEGIRGTLRDAVSYLFVELLGDTSLWGPEDANEVYRLELPRLLTGHAGAVEAATLNDAAVHPLMKVCAVLDDLEAWHAKAGRREAALEAYLERLRRLNASFSEEADREAVRAARRRAAAGRAGRAGGGVGL